MTSAILAVMGAMAAGAAAAHEIGGSDAAFVAASNGPQPFAFLYLGAKRMVTGYEHLLFLAGVVFLPPGGEDNEMGVLANLPADQVKAKMIAPAPRGGG